ncbi:hypothetical protein Tco_0018800 [Tanacetum coccineum]
MALPPRDQRHPFLRFEGLEYIDVDIADFKGRLGKIYGRGVHRGQSIFTSCTGRRLFETRGTLVHELILEFFSTFRMIRVVIDLDVVEEMGYAGFGLYWAESTRQISDKGHLSGY